MSYSNKYECNNYEVKNNKFFIQVKNQLYILKSVLPYPNLKSKISSFFSFFYE